MAHVRPVFFVAVATGAAAALLALAALATAARADDAALWRVTAGAGVVSGYASQQGTLVTNPAAIVSLAVIRDAGRPLAPVLEASYFHYSGDRGGTVVTIYGNYLDHVAADFVVLAAGARLTSTPHGAATHATYLELAPALFASAWHEHLHTISYSGLEIDHWESAERLTPGVTVAAALCVPIGRHVVIEPSVRGLFTADMKAHEESSNIGGPISGLRQIAAFVGFGF